MDSSVFFPSSPLVEKDRAHIWHPFTQMQTAPLPIPIVKAHGAYLYAEDGRRYLDAISSWWVNLHGHTHPYIVERIKAQLDLLEQVIFADFTHPPAVALASRLLPLLPGHFSKLFYSDNGSTAIEVALKMALQYWYNQGMPKRRVVCFKGGYHGDTFGAMAAAGKSEFNRPFWHHLFEVTAIDPPVAGREECTLSQLQSITASGEVACFIFEPLVLGSGGMILYSPAALDRLLHHCQEHGILAIADEVMTGFGRTGPLFACHYLQKTPDLICLSKGLTGGFLPLGITACREAIFNAFLGDRLNQAFLHGHSYTANPLACTSALASLDLLLTEQCAAQRQRIEASHKAFCQQWQSHPKLKRCNTLGTLLVLEYHTSHPSYFHTMRDQLYHFFLRHGILLRPLGNVLYVLPPYCIDEQELNTIYTHIITTLTEDHI